MPGVAVLILCLWGSHNAAATAEGWSIEMRSFGVLTTVSGEMMKLALGDYGNLLKWGLIAGAANAAGEAVVQAVTPAVATATQDSATNATATIKSIQESTGMNQDQATTIDLLAMGGMGA